MVPAARRVLLVTPDFPPSTGGIAVLMGRLVENMPGLEIRVLTFGEVGAAEGDRRAGAAVSRTAGVEMDRRLGILALNARLLREARAFRPDVIVSGHVVASIAAIGLRRLLGSPLVQYVHADEFRVRPRLTRAALRYANATIAVSGYTRDLALEAGADPGRVQVIPPGVDLVDAAHRAGDGGDGQPTLITVASLLSTRKGHDVMVEALPKVREAVPGARWVVIGDGPLRPSIEAAIRTAGLEDAVSLLGRVEDSVRDEWLDRADVFCMPSRIPEAGTGGEGFGIVYLEAGAHGLPVIGGRAAGVLDAVIDGETGILADPTDPGAIAAAAIELLSDPARAKAMGAAGRRHAEDHAWPRIGARVEELIEGVLAGGAR